MPLYVISLHSAVHLVSDFNRRQHWVHCKDGISVNSLSWVGPYSPAFYSNGQPLRKTYSLHEGRIACEKEILCEGLTGKWSSAKIAEREWAWELRSQNSKGAVMWISPSRYEEVTYVYNRKLSLNYDCCPAKFSRMLPIFYINLGYRSDRRSSFLFNLASKGVDVVRDVTRHNGINRSLYQTATDLLVAWKQPLTSNRVWLGHGGQAAMPDIRSERFKGKVASWIAHRAVWQRILNLKNVLNETWFVVLEDDVRLLDTVEVFLQKLSVTLCLYPSADMVYLTGREVPPHLPGNVVAYMGVDAYAVSSRAIPKLLDSTVFGRLRVMNSTALDQYLTALVLANIFDARMIVGGNPVVNSWKRFKSDIEIRP
eukprot:745853-Hanusia_phi.AAC.3